MSDKMLIKSDQTKNSNSPILIKKYKSFKFSEVSKKTDKNLAEIKQKIMNEMINEQYDNLPKEVIKNEKLTLEEYKYFKENEKYYEKNGITETIKKYINRMVMNNNYISQEFKILELQEILLKVVKKFTMNEYEIILFAAYLEKLKWKREGNTVEDFFSIVALFLKLKQQDNGPAYINYFGLENQDLISKLKDFLEIKNNDKINIKISQAELNKKFNELNQPSNIYCKKNYIDYNFLVDRILKMSVTYNEKKNKKSNQSLNCNISNNTFKLKGTNNLENNYDDYQKMVHWPIESAMNYNPNSYMSNFQMSETDALKKQKEIYKVCYPPMYSFIPAFVHPFSYPYPAPQQLYPHFTYQPTVGQMYNFSTPFFYTKDQTDPHLSQTESNLLGNKRKNTKISNNSKNSSFFVQNDKQNMFDQTEKLTSNSNLCENLKQFSGNICVNINENANNFASNGMKRKNSSKKNINNVNGKEKSKESKINFNRVDSMGNCENSNEIIKKNKLGKDVNSKIENQTTNYFNEAEREFISFRSNEETENTLNITSYNTTKNLKIGEKEIKETIRDNFCNPEPVVKNNLSIKEMSKTEYLNDRNMTKLKTSGFNLSVSMDINTEKSNSNKNFHLKDEKSEKVKNFLYKQKSEKKSNNSNTFNTSVNLMPNPVIINTNSESIIQNNSDLKNFVNINIGEKNYLLNDDLQKTIYVSPKNKNDNQFQTLKNYQEKMQNGKISNFKLELINKNNEKKKEENSKTNENNNSLEFHEKRNYLQEDMKIKNNEFKDILGNDENLKGESYMKQADKRNDCENNNQKERNLNSFQYFNNIEKQNSNLFENSQNNFSHPILFNEQAISFLNNYIGPNMSTLNIPNNYSQIANINNNVSLRSINNNLDLFNNLDNNTNLDVTKLANHKNLNEIFLQNMNNSQNKQLFFINNNNKNYSPEEKSLTLKGLNDEIDYNDLGNKSKNNQDFLKFRQRNQISDKNLNYHNISSNLSNMENINQISIAHNSINSKSIDQNNFSIGIDSHSVGNTLTNNHNINTNSTNLNNCPKENSNNCNNMINHVQNVQNLKLNNSTKISPIKEFKNFMGGQIYGNCQPINNGEKIIFKTEENEIFKDEEKNNFTISMNNFNTINLNSKRKLNDSIIYDGNKTVTEETFNLNNLNIYSNILYNGSLEEIEYPKKHQVYSPYSMEGNENSNFNKIFEYEKNEKK